jgi:hypothetical protein
MAGDNSKLQSLMASHTSKLQFQFIFPVQQSSLLFIKTQQLVENLKTLHQVAILFSFYGTVDRENCGETCYMMAFNEH